MQRARDDAFPPGLPSELESVAIEAGKILKRTALTRGQARQVTRAAVGHAVLTYPDRDHVTVAHEVEGWLLHGRGARKPCADVVARFRNFLANSDPRPAPPLPGNVAPIAGRGYRNDNEAALARARAMGAEYDRRMAAAAGVSA